MELPDIIHIAGCSQLVYSKIYQMTSSFVVLFIVCQI